MPVLTRQLIVLDMLLAELADYAEKMGDKRPIVSLVYINLLKQFCMAIQQLSILATSFTQYAFISEVETFGLTLPITNKRILSVYLRLIEYVIEHYQATEKIEKIRDSLFDENAEKRLHLLQVRAIKARAQFKTVVQALGKRDYQQFAKHLALPLVDWSWEVLRIEKNK
jgi:hypothetical protein